MITVFLPCGQTIKGDLYQICFDLMYSDLCGIWLQTNTGFDIKFHQNGSYRERNAMQMQM
jgi:hypothetical protein